MLGVFMSALPSAFVRGLRLVGVRALKPEHQVRPVAILGKDLQSEFSLIDDAEPLENAEDMTLMAPFAVKHATCPLQSGIDLLLEFAGLSSRKTDLHSTEPPASHAPKQLVACQAADNLQRETFIAHVPGDGKDGHAFHHRPARARRQGTFVLERSEKRQTIKTGSFAWAL